MVLVANKADLEGERVVSGAEGESLASELKVSVCVCLNVCVNHHNPHPHTLTSPQIKYVETSAKHRIHVDKAFHDLVRVIRQAQKPMPVKPRKKRRPCNLF